MKIIYYYITLISIKSQLGYIKLIQRHKGIFHNMLIYEFYNVQT